MEKKKLKTKKIVSKTNSIKKVPNSLETEQNKINALVDEFLLSFGEEPNVSNTKDGLHQTSTPQPIYTLVDDRFYELGNTSIDNYETNLLLGCNYFITPKTTLSVGFAPHIDFKSVAMLKQDNTEIVFDLFLWKKMLNLSSNIAMPYLENEIIQIKNSNEQFNVIIYFTVDKKLNGKIILCQNKSKIILDYGAWRKIYLLDYMIQCILYNNEDITENVRLYYIQYVEACLENQFMFLLKNHLMVPTLKNKNQWNYERFFYEIPIVCPKKLKFDIRNCQKKKYP